MSEKEVAALLGVKVSTLRKWRLLRKGPKWLKLGGGRAVRYAPVDVAAFINDSRVSEMEVA
jgi:predicted DNA-binding transcriptional regulator AlpA